MRKTSTKKATAPTKAQKTSANAARGKKSEGGKKGAVKTSAKKVVPTSALAGKKVKADGDLPFKKISKDTAQETMRLLCKQYPDADCELTFSSTFQLLTAVILSAQTTDVGVNKVTPTLFKRFPTAKAMAEANLDHIKEIVRPTGYYNAKATNVQKCAQALVERFNGEVPRSLEDLTTLPGVGRKTANVIRGVAYGEPGWTVDTHVQRLVKRLGFTDETDPYKIELALEKIFPNQDWSKYSITLIWHGRRLCYARKPDCPQCPVNHLCPSAQL